MASRFLAVMLPVLLWASDTETAGDIARKHDLEWISSGRATGAAFAVAQDGICSESGYFGAAKPDSLWRVASTTKVFTALAVMRLAERGILDLDRDVNPYLRGLQLPSTRRGTVTLRHLLTHTAGLDDPFVGSAYRAEDGPQPLISTVMKEWLPARLYEPREARLYSNFGYGLIGAVVESATGQSFEEIVAAEVLRPLALHDTTLRQPLDWNQRERVVPMLARNVWGRTSPAPILYHRSVPASAITTTLGDLTRLMLMVQRGGTVDGKPYLKRETLELMLGERSAPGWDREGYGFAYGVDGGRKYWYAGGDLGGHHTVILWFPDANKAFATVAASPGPMSTSALIPKLREHWFGPHIETREASPATKDIPSGAAGTYRPVRYPHNDLAKTFIIPLEKTLRVLPDGSFRLDGESGKLTVQTVSDGRVLLNRTWEKLAWHETAAIGVSAYFGFMLLAVALLLVSRGIAAARPVRWLCWTVLAHSVGWLGAVLWLDPQWLILGLPPVLQFFLWLGPGLVMPLWLWVCWQGVRQAWRRPMDLRAAACFLAAAVGYALYLPHLLYWRVVP